MQVAGLDVEDLDEDTARWVEWFVKFGDADTIGGLCALLEIVRGQVARGDLGNEDPRPDH